MKKKIVLQKISLIVCIIGFCIQASQVSIQYFGFTTTTKARLDVKNRITKTQTELCFIVSDILDLVKLREETGVDLAIHSTSGKSRKILEHLNVQQMLDYTPGVNRTIERCHVRDKAGFSVRPQNCYDYFEVSKYFTQEYICYNFDPRNNNEYDHEQLATSTHYNYLIHDLMMDKPFSASLLINPTLHYTE